MTTFPPATEVSDERRTLVEAQRIARPHLPWEVGFNAGIDAALAALDRYPAVLAALVAALPDPEHRRSER